MACEVETKLGNFVVVSSPFPKVHSAQCVSAARVRRWSGLEGIKLPCRTVPCEMVIYRPGGVGGIYNSNNSIIIVK